MSTLFDIFHSIQSSLFPWLEKEFDPLTEKERQFVRVVSLIDLEKNMTQYHWYGRGRKTQRQGKHCQGFYC